VVAYDQPAHGLSEGKLTGLPDFADVLGEIAAHHGDVRAVVGHSLGATAAAMAHAWNRLDVDTIVLISPPSDLIGYSRRFARWHWMPEPLRRAMQGAIEERYGIGWEELELARLAPRLAAGALVIHDREDRMVPWKQGAAVAQHWRGARLLTTQGLGHRRILQDEAITSAAAEFIAGRQA
jgi:pimeloyl-ACP methyl ester carboxylesterase